MSNTYDAETTTRPVSRVPFRGRYRTDPRTGETSVWDQNAGNYVPLSSSQAAPEFAPILREDRAELAKDNLAYQYGSQFLQLNAREPTGELWHGNLPFQNGEPFVVGNPRLQAMRNIANRFVRSQVREGTSGTANSGAEQQRIERSGPAVSFTGPANRMIVLNQMIDRDLRVARITALEEWARTPGRRSADGFEQWWTRQAPRVRAQIQRRYEMTNGPVTEQADRFGRQIPVTGRALGATVGRPQEQRRLRWNPETGDFE